MKQVTIFSDGACSGNPGPGGWGAILTYGEHRLEISGFEAETTNQKMEMKAALAALEKLKEPCAVRLVSDSAYLINGFNQKWLDKWQKNGWQTSKKTPVENQELWKALLAQAQKHKIEWVKVKGHAGHPENERCDELAKQAIEAKC
ncbi:MAG: ribonuclease HI [Clostridia bacterium]|nr:ribonuclease HI [Clostridia bacterium]MDD4798331.1 ribonuclease HI [Clostridia bacterium]